MLAVLCDLSKVFDVINQEIRLENMNKYGIRGIVSDWFRSYLSDRSQFVEVENTKSTKLAIECGVPQVPSFDLCCHLLMTLLYICRVLISNNYMVMIIYK